MKAAAIAAVRRVIPVNVRTALRRMRSELPVRIRDMRADLGEWVGISRELSLPPAWLRGRVGFTSSREEFLTIGGKAARDLLAVLEKVRPRDTKPERWLDL